MTTSSSTQASTPPSASVSSETSALMEQEVAAISTGHEEVVKGTKSRWGWLAGRGELWFVLLLVVLATTLLIGGLTMEVLGDSRPGPQFFPIVISLLLYISAGAIAISTIRNPTLPDGQPHPGRGNFSAAMLKDLGNAQEERVRRRYSEYSDKWATYSDWKTVGTLIAAMAAFIVILNPLGWVLSATMLFFVVVRALGSKNTWIDLGVALLFASVIQLAFNEGLGLPLPPGFLEGLL
ncbi:tripartite tricarboxylate transporter TctB family protein [Corynebacterium sp. J010B-136]|uniref:tripartite tricarboxylate transporter TctB family protein n=1 Tax=Corynebacterium sp. J010B-136 TaxID=2099401 RepID=UPI000CF93544|nr:tripartite tricarboxylate transporter TctB family protein [Corynebacterium sp. J010B-136]PQM74140.1 tripartite tricarboxylate transporter TctB family protein [Corynebacterium sp. J010B-136]